MINIKLGGKSWRILLIDSKFARSFSRKYFLYSAVIGSPILLVLLIVLNKNMIGRYSMCLWMFKLSAYSLTFLASDCIRLNHSPLKFFTNYLSTVLYSPWSRRTMSCPRSLSFFLTKIFPGWASQWIKPCLKIIEVKISIKFLATFTVSIPIF